MNTKYNGVQILNMAILLRSLRQRWNRRRLEQTQTTHVPASFHPRKAEAATVDIAPDDPIVAHFLSAAGAVEIDKLHLDSPALIALKSADVKLAVPLVSQGELVGLLTLGPRLSEQQYSAYDRQLLNTLAIQAAPAVRVAQMVREQQAAIRERERLDHELRIARLIQQTLLPKDLPTLPGWQLAAYYQSASAVGGDFYDFLVFEDGRLGIIIGDVSDKGVPAAMVMASARSILRSAAQGGVSPSKVLEQTNNLLCPDILPKMFVTCLYAILDPVSGRMQFANAGHDLPYRRGANGVFELRATGMPLGLMPNMTYEEKETLLAPGEIVLFYSDGLVEAHDPQREMFGFPHLRALLKEYPGNIQLIDFLLNELALFTGSAWEQEDDVTLVTLQRLPVQDSDQAVTVSSTSTQHLRDEMGNTDNWHILGQWLLASEPGNERIAMEKVAEAVRSVHLSTARLERLKTAVAETTMNAMEHGNSYRADRPVSIQVRISKSMLSVTIGDRGGTRKLPAEPEIPDIEAKLAELQTPRGWGLFLIKNMVDDMYITSDESHHTLELILYLEGENHDG
jgi:serine phosphatase RsbU (regulator of sigma subunit)/anti-sigma regulatory factor (Ser/Thr protein kinase)